MTWIWQLDHGGMRWIRILLGREQTDRRGQFCFCSRTSQTAKPHTVKNHWGPFITPSMWKGSRAWQAKTPRPVDVEVPNRDKYSVVDDWCLGLVVRRMLLKVYSDMIEHAVLSRI